MDLSENFIVDLPKFVEEKIAGFLACLDSCESGLMAIDLGAITRNYGRLCAFLAPTKVAAVIKADAYGFGAEKVGPVLYESGSRDFFVATIAEGLELRKILPENARIFALCGLLPGSEQTFLLHNIVPVLNSYQQAKNYQNMAILAGKTLNCALHFDTGMSRTGFCQEDSQKFFVQDFSQLNVVLVMSHLCCGDDAENPLNAAQMAKFTKIAEKFPTVDRSLVATSALHFGQDFRMEMARVGHGLYGLDGGVLGCNLEPALYVFAKIIQIRTVPAHSTVGYSAIYKTSKLAKLATLAIGYADGYFRAPRTEGRVVKIGGYFAPIVGRISMDFCVVDVSEIPDGAFKEGDFAQIVGDEILPKNLVDGSDLILHEIPILLGRRFRREYFW